MKKNIMLIDDNKIDLFISQKIIKKLGFESSIQAFVSGISALEFFKNLDNVINYETIFIPDIILLDINMPEMNGFQFLHEFNKLKNVKVKQIKIYILSSSTNSQDVKNAKSATSCLGFIRKPLTGENFNKILINDKPFLSEYDYQEKDINLDIIRQTS